VAFESAIELGGQTTPLVVRVDRRARRLIVRVDSRSRTVIVTAPSRRAVPDALRFARENGRWIERRLAKAEVAVGLAPGARCPYRGVPHRVELSGGTRDPVRRVEGREPLLLVGGDPRHLNRRLTDWLKREARREIETAVARYCALLGKTPGRIRLRDPRSRWGSCSEAGDLSFSWRLILAPPAILDYVAAHECAHLVHLDHSPAFWRTVEMLGPDPAAARRWFRQHGERLHAIGGAG
jgi:hypothetical protein